MVLFLNKAAHTPQKEMGLQNAVIYLMWFLLHDSSVLSQFWVEVVSTLPILSIGIHLQSRSVNHLNVCLYGQNLSYDHIRIFGMFVLLCYCDWTHPNNCKICDRICLTSKRVSLLRPLHQSCSHFSECYVY